MYTVEETQIFSFTIAGVTRKVDPIAALRKLRMFPNLDLGTDLTRAELNDPASEEILIAATRDVFELIPFDGQNNGVLDADVSRVLNEFFMFISELSKKNGWSLIFSPSTDAESNSTTKPSLDVGSISTDQPLVAP